MPMLLEYDNSCGIVNDQCVATDPMIYHKYIRKLMHTQHYNFNNYLNLNGTVLGRFHY